MNGRLQVHPFETYCFHFGHVWIEVWHFQRWGERLKRGLSPISIYP